MDELRLHTIGLYAGVDVTIPEPVEADGTCEGVANTALDEFGSRVGNIFEDAISSINCLWTLELFWPLVNLLVDLVASDYVSISIRVTMDLLGSVNMKEFDPNLFGMTMMSLQEGEQIIDAIDAETVWSRAVQNMIGITAVLFFALQLFSQFLTPAWEPVFWAMLGSALVSFVSTMVLLIWQTRAFNLDAGTKGIYFIYTGILTLGPAIVNYFLLSRMAGSSGGAAISKYFSNTYYKGNSATKAVGFKGRCHTAMMFAYLACFIALCIIAGGFALGNW